MFLNPKSWERWVVYFSKLGYECIAPAWPLHEGEPWELRENLPTGLGELSFENLYSHYRGIISSEAEPPIVVGHSLGGLIMQRLAADGLIKAGVGIASVAPNRMLALDAGFILNSAAITNPLAGDDPYEMSAAGFYKNFGDTMTEVASNEAYEEFATHESRNVLRDIMFSEGQIDVEKPHVPLLFVGAENDALIPCELVARVAKAYNDQRSHSEYVEFTNRGHFICGQPGWEEVSSRIANWLDAHIHAERA